MSVRLKAGAPPDRVLGAIETALSDKSQADVPRRWVVQSVNAETAELVFDFESLRDRADQYGRYEQATGNPVFLARWMAKLTSVDRSDVYDARKKYFAGGHVAALVEPVHGAPIGGRLTTRGSW
jgi:predicted Zn-dependent peptidase